jgi:hypothetical protein
VGAKYPEEVHMSRRVTIAIDGGIAKFRFDVGSLSGIHLPVGNAAITFQEVTAGSLVAGNCSHYWFEVDMEEGAGSTILAVVITTGADVSCNFIPAGLQGYHIPANNSSAVLIYERDDKGNIRTKVTGLTEAKK